MLHIARSILVAISLLGLTPASPAWAQDWPQQPVRLICPFPPGAGADLLSRKLAEKLSVIWKRPVIVENKPGAGEIIGATAVANAKPDGYTLLLATDASLQTNQFLYKKLPYSPAKDFTPISRIGGGPFVYVVRVDSPVQSIDQLIAAAKAKPGDVSYGTAGVGSTVHIAVEWLANKAGGVKFLAVPYQGAAPRLTALLGGQIEFTVSPYVGVAEYLKTKRLRPLATTSQSRMQQLPDVPTLTELGYKENVLGNMFAVVGPANMPTDLVNKIARDVASVVADPDFKTNVLEANALDPIVDTPAAFAQFLAVDLDRQRARVKAVNVTLD